MSRPRPTPLGWSRPSSTMREKRRNSRDRDSGGMPAPWSRTRITQSGPSADRLRNTWLSAAPYLMALVSRLITARRSSEKSPRTMASSCSAARVST